jgi:diguanylate cyclase (GGDEF)-like protein
VTPVRDDDGRIMGGVEIFSDNSNLLQILHEMECLKQDVYVDELTKVGNRRYSEMTLHTRFYELASFSAPFGVIFLDIDNFKQCNDRYGHKTGDEVLVIVARTIANILRRMDTIARWGGEEFVIILPNIEGDVLVEVAQRIRAFIEGSFLMAGGEMLRVTASLGATMALPDDTPESIVQRADRLMYASKMAGKNRVTFG